MQDLIDKILVVINECKDPIGNTTARNLRDDMLEILGKQVFHLERREFEAHAKNENELQALSWFYTRFVHFKTSGARGTINK